jgi:hypothetical protein
MVLYGVYLTKYTQKTVTGRNDHKIMNMYKHTLECTHDHIK